MAGPAPKLTDLRELIARLEVEFGRLDERIRSYAETLGESMELIKETNKRIESLAHEIRASREENKDSVRLLDDKVNREISRANALEERVSCLEHAQKEHEKQHVETAAEAEKSMMEAKKAALDRVQERKKFLWEKEISLKHALLLTGGTLVVTEVLNLLFGLLQKLIP